MITFGIRTNDVLNTEEYIGLHTFVKLSKMIDTDLLDPYSATYRWRTTMDDMETESNTQLGMVAEEGGLLDSVEGNSESPTTETEAELEVEHTEAEQSTDNVAVPGYNFISVVAV